MKRLIPIGLAGFLTVGMITSAWSQAGQSGGAGTAGTAGAANTPGTAGPANTPGAAGPANTPGAAGTAGVGAPGVPPNVNIGANPQSQGAGANPQSHGAGANPQSQGAGANPATQAPGFGMNHQVRQSPFFTDPGVRRQLNMNESQFNTLNRAYQNAYGRYNQNVRRLNNNLTPQQRQLQMQAFANQFQDEFGRTLDTTFTDPRYRARYDQLNRQYMGFNAFNNPRIQRQFNLTPQQMVQIRQLASVWREQLNRMRGQDGNFNINNVDQQQWAALYNQYWDQVNAVLTPEQQQLWTQFVGQRYTFPPQVYNFDNDFFNNQGQNPDGTVPGNPNGQIYGTHWQLKGTGTPTEQGGQTAPSGNPQQPPPPAGTANSETQGGSVR